MMDKKKDMSQEEMLDSSAAKEREIVDTLPEENMLGEASEGATVEESLQVEIGELKDTHLRLRAEYDNYRKRTLREKADLIKNGGERVLRDLLPVMDDFDLALTHLDASDDVEAMKEGFRLVHKKLTDYLLSVGVKPIDPIGQVFDDTIAEAIALVPAAESGQQSLVMDCTSRGYMLNDKVLRFAKVVVAQ